MERAKKTVRKFGEMAGRAVEENICYRIVSSTREFDLWEKHNGYSASESVWGRFVCTANPFLRKILRQANKIHYLDKGVILEVKTRYLVCPSYYDIMVTGMKPYGSRGGYTAIYFKDFLVGFGDLLLCECFYEYHVPVASITKIIIPKDAKEEIRRRAYEFARKYGVPVVDEDEYLEEKERELNISYEELIMGAREIRELSRKYNWQHRVMENFVRDVLQEDYTYYEKFFEHLDHVPYPMEAVEIAEEYSKGMGVDTIPPYHVVAYGEKLREFMEKEPERAERFARRHLTSDDELEEIAEAYLGQPGILLDRLERVAEKLKSVEKGEDEWIL